MHLVFSDRILNSVLDVFKLSAVPLMFGQMLKIY